MMELSKPFQTWVAEHVQPNMTDFEELSWLVHGLINSPLTEDSVIVEIGTFRGVTAALMGRVVKHLDKKNFILSIDPFEDYSPPDNFNAQGNYRAYKDNISRYGVKDLCVCLNGFSQQVAPAVSNQIAFLTIDGSHVYEDVLQDIKLYSVKVKKGGYIWIDDYSEWSYPGVFRAVNETLAQSPSFKEIIKHRHFVMYVKLE